MDKILKVMKHEHYVYQLFLDLIMVSVFISAITIATSFILVFDAVNEGLFLFTLVSMLLVFNQYVFFHVDQLGDFIIKKINKTATQ